MLASVIIDRARRTLLDPDASMWTDAQLLDYLSAAQSAVCQLKADAYPLRANLNLASGVSQQLASDALSLLEIYFNTNGTPVNQVGQSLMNNVTNWPATTQSHTVTEWMADQRDPRRFFVYPPNDGTGVVLVLYGAIPNTLTAMSDTLALVDTYQTALWAYTVALALAENTKRQDLTKSDEFLKLFNTMVVGRGQTQKINAPNLDPMERT